MAAIQPFGDLTGTSLELWFASFLKEKLDFEDYYPSAGQIELNQFDDKIPSGHHLEIDGFVLINKTCVLCEYTSEGGKFRDKIKKSLKNAQTFISTGSLSLKERFRLVGIPENRIDDFEEVTNWRLAYFGTHPEFENRDFRSNEFPEYQIAKELKVFKPDQIEYLRQLSNLIGTFAKNEFLAALGLSPIDLGDTEESLSLDYIKADGKYITEIGDVKADLYLVKLNVLQLLKMARVSRYEGIPLLFESAELNQNYQRFLKSEKLEAIASKFIANNRRKTFPNTITIALSNDCNDNGTKLVIPKKFSSLDIIDGQHRLFGYTHEQISQQVRNESEVLATAIKFRVESDKEITQNAARVFCEINSSQAKVQKDLLYLIKYDVLGDRDFPALAGKVILDCHKGLSKSLAGLFLISSLRRKNRLNVPSIQITEIIDLDLIPLMRGIDTCNITVSPEILGKTLGIDSTTHTTNPEHLCKQTLNTLDQYFSYVSSVFRFDWVSNAESHLLTATYFSAFIRLLRYLLYEEDVVVSNIRKELETLKTKIDEITLPSKSPSFHSLNKEIPHPNEGVEVAYQFLKGRYCSNFAKEVLEV
ncbi:hypothetical protein [uncultured Imperialibacter sp.]|uniref:hypothetical protein n=1 Tax=uncultured Imperialibacter sp. TaxID=1672639 RepID=UPI0030D8EFB3|tara:strand:- start:8054 stop:9820 length:1767 start_codon:yes stop_codon:yes gene_type:complete